MTPKLFRVGILITDRCDAECSHCWFDCKPKGETLPLSLGRKIIDQAEELGAEWVSFTGGEPFLEYENLRTLIGYAKKRGLKTETLTNCNWATTYDEAYERLGALKANGLDVVNLSVDDFHQENIPIDNVFNCFSAAKALDLKTVFLVAVRKGSRITGESLRALIRDDGIQIIGKQSKGKPSALVIESGFQPVGRGSKIPESEWFRGNGQPHGLCGLILRDIGISPRGEVYPCCGPLSCIGKKKGIGNIEERDLNRILEEAWGNEVYRKIAAHGPTGLVDFDDYSEYVDRCHLCYEAVRDLL